MLQVGQILNERYQLKQQLSQRGVRQTWLAIDLADPDTVPTLVIVKLLAFGELTQWQDYTLFQREAQVLQNLQHPRIPAYRDQFTLEGTIGWFAIVQDYIPGTSLQAFLDRGQRLTEAEVKQIAENVLQILIYLHELNPPILHRDIKPSNLIFDETGELHLVDFGAVQDRSAMERSTFTIVGTYGYTPLEQFGGRAVPASDLYALGATLMHVITGIAPADFQQLAGTEFWRSISLQPQFIQWLQKLSHPEITQRFQTARQALAELTQDSIAQTQPDVVMPSATKVQLHQSADFLQIKVARRGLQLSDALLLGTGLLTSSVAFLMLTSQVNPLLTLLCWVDSLPLLALGLFSAFSDAQLQFDRTSFSCRWTLLGIPYRQRQGSISSIQQIGNRLAAIGSSAATGITIHTSEQPYTVGYFAPELKPNESLWLSGEIQNWLNGSIDTSFPPQLPPA
ncbi:MAG TPA: serine/threonine-protein kinase [Trichocoleus sp.]